ncbi:MAG: hypothetical protein ACLVAW_03930 [Eisenbergiella massiliensis]
MDFTECRGWYMLENCPGSMVGRQVAEMRVAVIADTHGLLRQETVDLIGAVMR